MFHSLQHFFYTALARQTASSELPRPELAGTVYGMIPGSQYRVKKAFTDCCGNSFAAGELLRFRQRHFRPYHGGHTIVFEERALYLQEDQNRDMLENFSDYIVQIGQ